MTDSDQIALDAAHKIEALPRDLHKAQKTARIQLIVLDALAAQPVSPPPPAAVGGLALETEAAGRIIDVMSGGKFDWRSRIDDSEFLESCDWQCALSYARAATQPASPLRTDDPYLVDLEFANKANIEAARKYKARLEFMEAKYGQIDWDASPPEQLAAAPVGQSMDEAAADNFGLTVDDLDEGDDE